MKVQGILFNLFVVFIALFATLAAAHPNPKPSKTTKSVPTPTLHATCKSGKIQCCESVQHAKKISGILGLFGYSGKDLEGNVGLTCKTISAADVKAGKCSGAASPVCCDKNDFNGLFSMGCTPFEI